MGFYFIYVATHLLSRPSPVQQGVNKGILIGYTTSGTPLYSFTSPESVIATAKVFLKQVLAETESRQIFYFLCLNLVGIPCFVISKTCMIIRNSHEFCTTSDYLKVVIKGCVYDKFLLCLESTSLEPAAS